MSAYSKDLCVIHFNEHSHKAGTQKTVLNAFREGIMCFQFKFVAKTKAGVRRFEDRVALPADADEECALEMAEEHYLRFLNTVAKTLIAQ